MELILNDLEPEIDILSIKNLESLTCNIFSLNPSTAHKLLNFESLDDRIDHQLRQKKTQLVFGNQRQLAR